MHEFIYDYSKLLGRMREKGVTQGDLACKIGISEPTLNLTLNNKRRFKQDEISKICVVLDIPVAEIEFYFFCRKSLDF